MARVVLLLVLSHWFGKEKGAPVGEGADDAAVLEEEGAGFVGDSDGDGSACIGSKSVALLSQAGHGVKA